MPNAGKSWIVRLAILTIVVMPALAAGGVRVSPAFVEVSLDKGRPAGSFQITNTGKTPERFRVRAVFFNLSEKGGLVRPKNSPFSIAPLVKFNPAEFQLPPNSMRQVRFIIVTRGKLKPGEYWAGMEIESLKTQSVKGTDEGGREFMVRVVPSVLVPIFGKVGKVKYAGKLEDVQLVGSAEKPQLSVMAVNEGDGRVVYSATYEVLSEAGKTVQKGILAKSYVFRGGRIRLRNYIKPLPAGQYTVRIHATSAQLGKPIKIESKLTWTAPTSPPVAGAAKPTTRPAGEETAKNTNTPPAKTPVAKTDE